MPIYKKTMSNRLPLPAGQSIGHWGQHGSKAYGAMIIERTIVTTPSKKVITTRRSMVEDEVSCM